MTKEERMQKIEEDIKRCRKCRLCELAHNAVPGEGNINTEIVFVGEAPGEKEDLQGRPFIGRAGKLLDQMLSNLNIERKDIWIGNIIKHRPPENRDPLPDEIATCSPYLTSQLDIINPKLVVTLGRFAMNYFYPQGKISLDHGRLISLDKYKLFPMYHPAAALRNPTMAKSFKEDFSTLPTVLQKVKSDLGKADTTNKSNNLVTHSKSFTHDENQLGLFK